MLAQHVEPRESGAHTGWTVPEALNASGAAGSLVNHSEHPLMESDVRLVVESLLRHRLVAVVCARDVANAARLASLFPPYLAVEPPELIGGDRAVSTAAPEIVSGTVDAVRRVAPNTVVLCGAGVHDRHDVRRALELGSGGVLVASAVAKSPSPGQAIVELLQGFD